MCVCVWPNSPSQVCAVLSVYELIKVLARTGRLVIRPGSGHLIYGACSTGEHTHTHTHAGAHTPERSVFQGKKPSNVTVAVLFIHY